MDNLKEVSTTDARAPGSNIKWGSTTVAEVEKSGVIVDVNERDEEKETPLHHAAGFNPNVDVVFYLIKNGADIDAEDEYGTTPLQEAIMYNLNSNAAKTLIRAGADLSKKNINGNTAVHTAARFNTDPNIIILLALEGADLDARNNDNKTPLYYALMDNKNNKIIMKTLTILGADLDTFKKEMEEKMKSIKNSNNEKSVKSYA